MDPLLIALLLAATQAADAPAEPMQAADSYEAALKNHSTSPSYVRISVSTGGAWRTTCTTANLLQGAVMLENGLRGDTHGIAKAERLALANTTQHFHFSRPEAMANLPDLVSNDDLALMHRRFNDFTAEELRAGLAYRGSLRPLVEHLTDKVRNAAACALIERGLSPWQADISGQLFVTRD